MCFHSKQSKDAQTLENRFNAKFASDTLYTPTIDYNAFAYPKTPIITSDTPHEIQMFCWGLLPSFAPNLDYRKLTLNAKIETISEKPSFKLYVKKRCIILVDGFYEWKWLDPKGKQKQKYLLEMADHNAFAIAGLWNIYTDKQSGEVLQTYTMLTTEANTLMAEIHNTKKRMPMVLGKNEEKPWLDNEPINTNRYNIPLVAIKE